LTRGGANPAVPHPAGPHLPGPRGALLGAAVVADETAATPRAAAGCAFHGRCRYGQASCLLAVPPLVEIAPQHLAACHRWREVVYS
ncbi:MAG: hypothetical protein M3O41_19245, partial [Pseudomonadota bacterium]|nr:hypothetical protein [Pseudomonadota bacterium]